MKNVLERLINLLVMLLTSSRPVPAEEIRRTIPGYSSGSDDAFHRMFERDKDLLRGIGIPLELKPTDGWEVEHGYVVDPEKYRLPDPGLTDEERAALFQAAQTVTLGGEPAAPGAILKLGGARLAGAVEPLAADLGAAAETLGDLFQAVSERRSVRFKYKGDERQVAPYGIGHRRGHWYLVGGTRDGERMYRVDRMDAIRIEDQTDAFQRPKGFKIKTALDSMPWEAGTDDAVDAVVRFNAEIAWWAARQLGAAAGVPTADGGLEVTVSVANREAFLGWVVSFGEGAEVVGPKELRRAVIDRVKGTA
jgi:predicted DNA-binding transcriptional regulator YafY